MSTDTTKNARHDAANDAKVKSNLINKIYNPLNILIFIFIFLIISSNRHNL